jgi:hypothetical protein
MIHNICCDLYLDVEYGISRRLVYPNLSMIKYRNIIFSHIPQGYASRSLRETIAAISHYITTLLS